VDQIELFEMMTEAPQNSSSDMPSSLQEQASLITFQHDHLEPGYMRLVKVMPVAHSLQRVRCTLRTVKILTVGGKTVCISDDEGELVYRAISYTWGDSSTYRIIDINGEGFAVRENLWQFLDVARRLARGIWLWIDALCINQADVQERNRAVRHMDRIYSNALQVLIWLGPAVNSAELMPWASAWNPHRDKNSEDALPRPTPENEHLHYDLANAMVFLCRHDYWNRTWIIQEFIVAEDLLMLIGPQATTVEGFIKCLSDTNDILRHAREGDFVHGWERDKLATSLSNYNKVRALNSARKRWRDSKSLPKQIRLENPERIQTLVRLLQLSKDSKCSDLRDRVFGLVGLIGSGKFEVNYRMDKYDLLLYTLDFIQKEQPDLEPNPKLWRSVCQLAKSLDIRWKELLSKENHPNQIVIELCGRTRLSAEGTYIDCLYCRHRFVLDTSPVWRAAHPDLQLEMCCLMEAEIQEHLFFFSEGYSDNGAGNYEKRLFAVKAGIAANGQDELSKTPTNGSLMSSPPQHEKSFNHDKKRSFFSKLMLRSKHEHRETEASSEPPRPAPARPQRRKDQPEMLWKNRERSTAIFPSPSTVKAEELHRMVHTHNRTVPCTESSLSKLEVLFYGSSLQGHHRNSPNGTPTLSPSNFLRRQGSSSRVLRVPRDWLVLTKPAWIYILATHETRKHILESWAPTQASLAISSIASSKTS